MKNYYKILDVPETAEKSDIEKAYKRLKELIVNNSISLYSILTADEKDSFLNDIEEAYQTLITPEKKTIYDLQLKGLPIKSESEEVLNLSHQLSFEFAKDTFTFLDYTQLKQDLYKDILTEIQKDNILRSKGISITIVEKEVPPPTDEPKEPILTTSEETINQKDNISAEYVNSNFSNEQVQPPVQEQSTKENTVLKDEQDSPIVQTEDKANIAQPDEDAIPSTETKNECHDIIIVDENSEFSGHFLKQIRESMGITIKEISQITKISVKNISNIEEENYDELPPLVYIKGYLIQIAKCLNLRPDLVARSYLARMNDLQKNRY